jgi:hypothetical protein
MSPEGRKKRRKTLEEFDKTLIKLSKRRNELYRMRMKLPMIKLDKPIQKGWKKGFILREDINRHPNVIEIKKMLEVINQYIYSDNIEFKVKKYHSKQNEDKVHALKHIPEKSWDKLGWPEHYKTRWFKLSTKLKLTPYGGSYMVKGYWFKYPWMFVTEITPNIITHVRAEDPNIRKELAEIERYFEANEGHYRLAKLRGGYHSPWDEFDVCKEERINDIIEKEVEEELNNAS